MGRYNWCAQIEGHSNCFTAAPTLEQLPQYLCEVAKLMLGVTVNPDWDLDEKPGETPSDG
jgi:hypothetical protein